MASPETFEHLGIVCDVSDNLVKVKVMPEQACGNCRAKGSCSLNESGERTIEAYRKNEDTYSAGEKVRVKLERSLGIKALMLGYLIPFLITLLVLIFLIAGGINEGIAGLLALVSLVPYYFILSLFKDSLKKEFSFRLEKCNN
jgi:positive regulator of sigma E activity